MDFLNITAKDLQPKYSKADELLNDILFYCIDNNNRGQRALEYQFYGKNLTKEAEQEVIAKLREKGFDVNETISLSLGLFSTYSIIIRW